MVLEEKGILFDRIEINLPKKEQKTKAYLAINPLGQVPVYQDDAGVHIDSLVIMRYLDERYPKPKLFPDDAAHKHKVLEWIELSSGPIRDVSHKLYWQLLEPPQTGTDWSEVKQLKEQGYSLLNSLEDALRDHGDWLCGDFSAADISIFAWLYGYKRFDLPETWEKHPKLRNWYETLELRPSVKNAYMKEGRPFIASKNS